MRQILATICFAITLGHSVASATDLDPPRACKRVDANSKSWTHPSIGGHANEIWIARPECKSINTASRTYYATGGGFRYEGIWSDPTMTQEWQIVASEPYQSIGNGPVEGWQCVVKSIGVGHAPVMPEPIWCSAVCCPN